VRSVNIAGVTVNGVRSDNTRFTTTIPMIGDDQLMDDLFNNNVEIRGLNLSSRASGRSCWSLQFPDSDHHCRCSCFSCARCRAAELGGKGGPMSFGKSKAKMLGEDQIKVTFADVAGVTKPRKMSRSWWISCASRTSSSAWAAGFRAAC
jgi:cell division protease FtsH